MIADKKEFTGGMVLLVLFFVVLYVMFLPIFNGKNAMAYLDHLYNTISKGSVYYIPGIQEEVDKHGEKSVELTLKYETGIEASQSVELFGKAGLDARLDGMSLSVSGPLGTMLGAALKDSDLMYHNDGSTLDGKYAVEPRRVMYNWWTTLALMDKVLKDQGEFEAAKVTSTVLKKGVETAYNYYEIEPAKISDEIGMVIFSLVFYVVYTLWYGFAILFVFEGWGLRLSH